MSSPLAVKFIDYIQQEMNVSDEAIAVARRQTVFSLNQFPIVLWQMGFVSLDQLDSLFDWLEQATVVDNV